MFSLALPFHSDYERILRVFKGPLADISKLPIKEILLCHNGLNLTSFDKVAEDNLNVKLLHTPKKGLGAAFKLAIENASGEYILMSASDLPFGFSDIESFLEIKERTGAFPEVAVGSKFHPKSNIAGYPFLRILFSRVFYLLRIVLLSSSSPRDSQGSLFCSMPLARKIIGSVESDDYFFSLEFLTLASRNGAKIVELPITFTDLDRGSSVSPVKDGYRMFKKLLALRKRIKRI